MRLIKLMANYIDSREGKSKFVAYATQQGDRAMLSAIAVEDQSAASIF